MLGVCLDLLDPAAGTAHAGFGNGSRFGLGALLLPQGRSGDVIALPELALHLVHVVVHGWSTG